MSKEAMKLALEALERTERVYTEPAGYEGKYGKSLDQAINKQQEKIDASRRDVVNAIAALREALSEQLAPGQEPVSFYIYKTTPPHGNLAAALVDGVLPWVYDQDPSSGFVARMLVTPYPPQPQAQPAREWVGLTDAERIMCRSYDPEEAVAKTEAKLKEKNT